VALRKGCERHPVPPKGGPGRSERTMPSQKVGMLSRTTFWKRANGPKVNDDFEGTLGQPTKKGFLDTPGARGEGGLLT